MNDAVLDRPEAGIAVPAGEILAVEELPHAGRLGGVWRSCATTKELRASTIVSGPIRLRFMALLTERRCGQEEVLFAGQLAKQLICPVDTFQRFNNRGRMD